MRAFWWCSNALFGALSLVSVYFVVSAFKNDGSADYRAIGGALLGLGAIVWSISIKKHPKDWHADEKA